jgi:glutamate-1-semialdehyde 2,1-aminomutase
VQYAGNLFSVSFTEDLVSDYAQARAAQSWRYPAFFHAWGVAAAGELVEAA